MFTIGGKVDNVSELLNQLMAHGGWNCVSVRKNKEWIEYINLPLAFDIETSSFYSGDKKQAIMYHWQLGLNGYVITGRTWNEFMDALEEIMDFFCVNPQRILPIYIRNLSYEFGWIKDKFEWSKIFAREKRKPLKALTVDGIEFRDSLILSGTNLATTGKNLTKYKCQKMVGDLDYSLIRTPLTPLTDKELGYCINDVMVDMCYIQEQIEMYGDITKIPMTNTGRVREYCRKKCLSSTKYKNLVQSLKIEPDEYVMLKEAFTGGFTHANYRNVGKVHCDVSSIDFTSSYPTVLVAEDRFPMSSGEWVDLDENNYDDIVKDHCIVFNARFHNLVEKNMIPDHYISSSKCRNLQGEVEDNGRIITAISFEITITEVDFEIIKKCYDFDEVEFGDCLAYRAGYLPTEFIECVLSFYNDKTTLKDVAGMEAEYQLKKGMLNSCYGMIVTDICSDEIVFNNYKEWQSFECDIAENIDKYNNDRKRFLFYPWGIYCTAYARRNLWFGILEMGQDQIYADTDSCKFMNLSAHQKFIDDYNDWIIKRLENALDFHHLSHDLIKPKTVKGKEKPLGVWDFEGTYDKFKTLGAKRYMVEKHGEIQCTIAGSNKKMTSEWLSEQDDSFGTFTNEMTVPADRAGRNIVTYFDDPCEGDVVDYLGTPFHYYEDSFIHMEASEYNLSISDKYIQLLGCVFVDF